MVQRDDTELFFEFDTTTRRLQIGAEGAPRGNLGEFHAHWLTADTVAWKIDLAEVNHFRLHFAGDGRLTVDRQGLGGTGIRLRIDEDGFPEALRDRWPHLASFTVLKLKPEDRRFVRAALKGQVAVAAYGGSGTLLDATGLQIAGVLDDLYTYDGPLGVSLAGDLPTLTVWAPTARSVRLHRFADAEAATQATVQPMRMDPDTGVWSITGRPDWLNQFYLFEVEVIRPVERRVVTSLVTDPYSLSLSMNSRRSQIIDLGAPSLTPAGWAELVKPPLAAPEESVIYELHVRDFSALDETVPADLRGKSQLW